MVLSISFSNALFKSKVKMSVELGIITNINVVYENMISKFIRYCSAHFFKILIEPKNTLEGSLPKTRRKHVHIVSKYRFLHCLFVLRMYNID